MCRVCNDHSQFVKGYLGGAKKYGSDLVAPYSSNITVSQPLYMIAYDNFGDEFSPMAFCEDPGIDLPRPKPSQTRKKIAIIQRHPKRQIMKVYDVKMNIFC